MTGDNAEQKGEKISVLDPRRFTPTLHANLVSEILSLRRELESKNSLVLNLEENLVSTKDENTQLQEVVAHNTKENKSLKRQMDTLEGSTLAAIEELAKERNKATEALSDVRSRLDSSQKKLRSQQEDSERAQSSWERDREQWEAERRILERKNHVVEGRLRTVLSEVATSHASGHPGSNVDSPHRAYSKERSGSRASGTRSSTSRHRDSFGNEIHERATRFSIGMAPSGNKTLADELDFEDSEGDSDGDLNSPEALPEEVASRARPYSVQSHRQSIKAKKLLGLNTDGDEDSEIGRETTLSAYTHPVGVFEFKSTTQPSYADTATQYSQPPSPDLMATKRLSTIAEIENDLSLDDAEVKQTTLEGLSRENDPSTLKDARPVVMVSSACQTIEPPLSPPETPVLISAEDMLPYAKVEMATTSTQTTESSSPQATGSQSAVSITTEVPLITIHPAVSGSARSSVVLPPNYRNASCQANVLGEVRSVATQTENIRTAERLFKIPVHLHPEVIRPLSPSPSLRREVMETKVDRKSQIIAPGATAEIPPRPSSLLSQRRRSRLSRLSTNFDVNEESDDGHISDDSFLTKEPIRKVLSRVNNSWKTVASPTDAENFTDTEELPLRLRLDSRKIAPNPKKPVPEKPKSPQQKFEERSGKVLTPIDTGSQDVRRAALVASGTNAHIQRARSPSEPAIPSRGPVPPFPVPDRSSSRKLWSPSDPGDSPTRSANSHERHNRMKRSQGKRPAIRKIRSAVATNYREDRPRSRSPPPFETFTDSLAHIPPPLPDNEITSPFPGSLRQDIRPTYTRENSSRPGTAASDQRGVVDSIAQTMIGEWMWKYVRRRKSFGLGEAVGTDLENGRNGDGVMNGGTRHQRWVWVGPYERAIMWSSKQPSSGSALMGKSGRKRKSRCHPTVVQANIRSHYQFRPRCQR